MPIRPTPVLYCDIEGCETQVNQTDICGGCAKVVCRGHSVHVVSGPGPVRYKFFLICYPCCEVTLGMELAEDEQQARGLLKQRQRAAATELGM